jgi:DNA-directed RNA polymerase specialized sigma24 family protein
MEYLRDERRREVTLDAVPRRASLNDRPPNEIDDERAGREKLMSCLDQCTEKLEPLTRDLIIRYYFGERRVKIENRRALAATLGLTINALSIRACRIRSQLEACVENCVAMK